MTDKALTESPSKRSSDPSGRRSANRRRAVAGYTIMEMLVVVAVIGILAGLTIAIFNSLRPKMALTNVSRELNGMFQRARMTAIRQNLTVIGEIETEPGGEVTSYNPGGIKNEWLVLKTVDAYGTQTEFDSYQMYRGFPPVHFWGNAENTILGSSANTFPGDTLAYTSDGSVAATGALRISYAKSGSRNTMEVAVPTQSGVPVVRKFLQPGDRPSTAASQEFFEETVASASRRRALWVWY